MAAAPGSRGLARHHGIRPGAQGVRTRAGAAAAPPHGTRVAESAAPAGQARGAAVPVEAGIAGQPVRTRCPRVPGCGRARAARCVRAGAGAPAARTGATRRTGFTHVAVPVGGPLAGTGHTALPFRSPRKR